MTKRNVHFCRTGEQGATDIMVEGLGRYVPYDYHRLQVDKASNATLAMRIKELTDQVMRLSNERDVLRSALESLILFTKHTSRSAAALINAYSVLRSITGDEVPDEKA